MEKLNITSTSKITGSRRIKSMTNELYKTATKIADNNIRQHKSLHSAAYIDATHYTVV